MKDSQLFIRKILMMMISKKLLEMNNNHKETQYLHKTRRFNKRKDNQRDSHKDNLTKFVKPCK